MEYSDLDKVLNNEAAQPKQGRKRKNKKTSQHNLSDIMDGGLALAHRCLTGNEVLRLATEAIPGTRDYYKQHCVDISLLPPLVAPCIWLVIWLVMTDEHPKLIVGICVHNTPCHSYVD
jgi:digalactosyldiacylglycerol synthase